MYFFCVESLWGSKILKSVTLKRNFRKVCLYDLPRKIAFLGYTDPLPAPAGDNGLGTRGRERTAGSADGGHDSDRHRPGSLVLQTLRRWLMLSQGGLKFQK